MVKRDGDKSEMSLFANKHIFKDAKDYVYKNNAYIRNKICKSFHDGMKSFMTD